MLYCNGQLAGSSLPGQEAMSKTTVLSLPFTEDFTGVEAGEMPEHWVRTHANWAVANSNIAGGASAPELRLDYSPANEGSIRAITPLLDATEITETIRMEFMHRLDHFSGSYYLKVQTSLDGEEWIDQWVVEVDDDKADIPSRKEVLFLTGIQGEEFHLAFVFEGNTDHVDRWYIDDVSVGGVADMFEVVFKVLEDSDTKDPIADAVIHKEDGILISRDDGTASTFLTEGVLYEFTVTADGYVTQELEFTMPGEAVTLEILMTDIVLVPRNLRIATQGLDPGEALLTWTDYGEEYEYRYDDGNATSQLGHREGTLNSLHGAAHHNDALLYRMAWMLTSEGGPHNSVKLWVIGLGDDGLPDRDQVLYTAENVDNTDNEWMVYEFDEPVEAPNGFFLGVSYNGFLGLATDNGITPGYEFIPGTQFSIFNITSITSEFTDIQDFGFTRNFLIRAYGENFGELEYGKKASRAKHTAHLNEPAPVLIPLETPFYTGEPRNKSTANKVLLGFNVFLNDELVATEVEGTEYMFTGLHEGEHQAGVQSVYTTTTSGIPTLGFLVDQGVFISEVAEGDVAIYPNPASDKVVVQSSGQIIGMALINLLGQLKVYREINSTYTELDVSNLNAGVYFIQLTKKTGVQTYRLQIAR